MFKFVFIILLLFVLCFFIIDSTSQNNETFNESDIDIKFYQKIEQSPINIYDNFITSEQCDILINLAKDKFKDSTIYSKSSGIVDKTARSSTNTYFTRNENNIVDYIETKITKILNIDRLQLEPLQIVKYDKGQEYKLHYDFFDENSDQYNNQRTDSIIIYLNDLDIIDGGATFFPLYKMRFFPYKTRALHWENMNCNKELNKLSLHCGEPIESNKTKYILTIWVREKPYQ